uniref:peptidylprolyl isomerase n=1 Tax=Leptobrachium leishanense TaxID=445787 RepID=A0A8C5QXX5_9ANUR
MGGVTFNYFPPQLLAGVPAYFFFIVCPQKMYVYLIVSTQWVFSPFFGTLQEQSSQSTPAVLHNGLFLSLCPSSRSDHVTIKKRAGFLRRSIQCEADGNRVLLSDWLSLSLTYTDAEEGMSRREAAACRQTDQGEGKLEDGTEFDSSIPRKQPFTFKLGTGQVIKGWDQGLLGMCEGEKRKLVIPSELGYGDRGAPPKIPGTRRLKSSRNQKLFSDYLSLSSEQ